MSAARYGDVFTFDFPSSTWKKMHCTGTDLADGRYAHSAVLRHNCIYLYGGNDGVRHEDLLQLDLESRVWSRIPVRQGGAERVSQVVPGESWCSVLEVVLG